mmetsp:Transcript_43318/g.60802  ORF Transcript_43318/g.60802 Transcript_43318/m.60802 type:complete len:100 (+) Transcript_43318:45-344(+)
MRNCKEDFFVGKLNSNEKQKTYFFDNKKLMKYFEFFSKLLFLFFQFILKKEKNSLFFRKKNSYLVDPASSHMLVLKTKPCMSKYKHLYCETANGSLNQL